MDQKYIITISSKQIYRELNLSAKDCLVKVGTGKDVNLRLNRELFFDNFFLVFENRQEIWHVEASESVYISADDIMKLSSKELHHGDTFSVKYHDSNLEVLRINFTLDFDSENKNYDRVIDITGIARIDIGNSSSCQISIKDDLKAGDTISLLNNNGKYTLVDNKTTYGAYVNGERVKSAQELSDYDFFSMMGYSFYIKHGKLYTSIDSNIRVSNLEQQKISDSKSHLDYPKFNRNSRVQHIIPDDPIEIKQPPQKPTKPKKNILVSLIPALAMLGLIILMRNMMGSSGSTFIILSGGMMMIGVLMSIVTFITDGREYKKDLVKREEQYLEYIEEKKTEITGIRENELRVRKEIHTSLSNNIAEIQRFGRRLFEKDKKDKDYLNTYLGTGTLVAKCPVKYNNQESMDRDDPIAQLAEQLENQFRHISQAPVVSTLAQDNVLGIVGRRDKLYDMMKNITLDVALRHFYKDVKMVYMFREENYRRLQWLRWLKHVENDQLNIRNLMCDEESNNILLEYLYSLLSVREASNKESSESSYDENYLVFIFDSKEIAKHPISKYFDKASEFGFTFLFFEEYEELLPKGCAEIIRLNNNDASATILSTQDCEQQTPFSYEAVKDGVAEAAALKMSAVYVDEVTLESQLTRNITLFELLEIMEADDLDLSERWQSSQVYQNMAAPLGVKKKGEVVYLDISDKSNAHGPHGLVAGTTGSGKSEILQSYVLSMASLFHPYDVGFLIIDFKGGGMANQFEDLPHLMGAITNIDGREINRSLLSIKAELIKRQELFSQSGVNHINDYIKLYKEGKVSIPMPHLIMIVDEFAELKAEFPDFMDEVVSAARIGRTLGVHLILATQKPSGVVNDQIWSNSKFKLCLKVQTKEDSSEVIKSPLAAEIVEPGRAYFQVGNNEIFELFQSAYSGAKVSDGRKDAVHTYEIHALNLWGKRELVYTNKKPGEEKDAKNQLDAMVEYMEDYCVDAGIQKLQGICLPPLADHIFASELDYIKKEEDSSIRIPVGFFDDPEQQKQGVYSINISITNTFIIGTSQMGKTTMLQTILYQLMNLYTPRQVNLYIIDCGNMALKPFETANHVGGVAVGTEEEKIVNLFRMISKIISERKKIFMDRGLGTYKAYIEAGYDDLPQIVLVIDNMAAFRELYESLDDEITAFSREGQSIGLTLVVTSSQTNGLGFRALANFGTKIAFTCNDAGEYSNLYDRCKIEPKEVAGRALCQSDKRIMEFQAALAFEGEKEFERVEAMRSFIQTLRTEYADCSARLIPQVSEVVDADHLVEEEGQLFEQPYVIPYGVSYREVEYQMMNLLTLEILGISGRDKSGKTNLVRYMLKTMERLRDQAPSNVFIFDSDLMQLERLESLSIVKEYTTDASLLGEVSRNICDELEARQARVIENRGTPMEEVLAEDPLLVMVIDRREIINTISGDLEVQTYINKIRNEYRKLKVLIVFSNIENTQIGFASPEIIKSMDESGKVIVFEEPERLRLLEIDAFALRNMKKDITLGDAFTNLSGDIEKVKTIYQS